MSFDIFPLGAHLGIHVASPYLDPEVVSHALSLSKAQCVQDIDGTTHGKVPLRSAFCQVSGLGDRGQFSCCQPQYLRYDFSRPRPLRHANPAQMLSTWNPAIATAGLCSLAAQGPDRGRQRHH